VCSSANNLVDRYCIAVQNHIMERNATASSFGSKNGSNKRLKTDHVGSGLLSFDNDIIALGIGPFLQSNDMLRLALSCRRFGLAGKGGSNDISLMEEAAMRLVSSDGTTAAERACIPRADGESWMGIHHELQVLRQPLFFDQLVGDGIEYDAEDKATVCSCSKGFSTALGNMVMRAGKHYVEFERDDCEYNFVQVGIMRRIKGLGERGMWEFSPLRNGKKLLQEKTEKWGSGNVHAVLCNLGGTLDTNWSDWDKRLPPDEGVYYNVGSGKLGMLLDLDEGTLTVYKNGRSRGVKVKSGLTGEYCWAVEIYDTSDGTTVHMERGSIPG